jgi:hypothetical protein
VYAWSRSETAAPRLYLRVQNRYEARGKVNRPPEVRTGGALKGETGSFLEGRGPASLGCRGLLRSPYLLLKLSRNPYLQHLQDGQVLL